MWGNHPGGGKYVYWGISSASGEDLRVLVDEGRRIVDLIVDHDIQILLRRMFGYLGIGDFF